MCEGNTPSIKDQLQDLEHCMNTMNICCGHNFTRETQLFTLYAISVDSAQQVRRPMKGQTLHLDFLTARRKIARAFLRSSAEKLYMGTSFSNFFRALCKQHSKNPRVVPTVYR